MSSKPLNASETSAYERWELPHVGEPAEKKETEDIPTAADIESIQQQAYDEGFQRGHQDGVEKGLADARELIEQQLSYLHGMISQLAEPFAELDEAVIRQAADLAMMVARQLVRRELHIDPGQVVAVVREAIQALPISVRGVEVYLHPEDAQLLREAFSVDDSGSESALSWKILEEPLLNRGDCKVQAENSTIDATLEKRLNRIINSVLGGERENDRSD